jgi:CRP-like cAMP-binding protein
MREGEAGREAYLIKEGEVQVLKREAADGTVHELTRFGSGAVVGEIALLDGQPRSASVRALTATTLLAFAAQDLAALDAGPRGHIDLVDHLSRSVAGQLRVTSDLAARLLRQQVTMARFLTFVVFSLSIYAFVLSTLTRYATQTASTTFVTVSMLVALTGAVMLLIRQLGYPIRFYGLTLANWRPALVESLAATAGVCALIVALKWIGMSLAVLPARPLFEPFAALNAAATPPEWRPALWLMMAGLYSLHAPFQEFVVRGCLQGAMQRFLSGPSAGTVSIIGSNLVFSAFHLFISMGFAVVTFLPGLLWGWLYRRHGTLVGVAVSHLLIGLWAVFVVGIEGVLF